MSKIIGYAKATPRPWEVNTEAYSTPGIDGPKGGCLANVFDEFDAVHIVKCVNLHDELVEALTLARAVIKRIQPSEKIAWYEIEKIQDTLAKAEGRDE